jgi:hypothetical protein
VELLVAAVIILVSVAAVVAVVRKSTDMQITDIHRRQARAIIMKHLETDFSYQRFSKAVNPSYQVVISYISVEEESDGEEEEGFGVTVPVGSNPNFTNPVRVVLNDGRGGKIVADTLWGNIAFRAVAGTSPVQMGDHTANIHYHDITIRVDWVEFDGTRDTVQLTKRLANTYDR